MWSKFRSRQRSSRRTRKSCYLRRLRRSSTCLQSLRSNLRSTRRPSTFRGRRQSLRSSSTLSKSSCRKRPSKKKSSSTSQRRRRLPSTRRWSKRSELDRPSLTRTESPERRGTLKSAPTARSSRLIFGYSPRPRCPARLSSLMPCQAVGSHASVPSPSPRTRKLSKSPKIIMIFRK